MMQEMEISQASYRINFEKSVNSTIYRKRPRISHTFFHKIEAKNQGCGLSTDTSVLGVLKHPN